MKAGDIVFARCPGLKTWDQAWEAEVVEVCSTEDYRTMVRVRPTPATVERWRRSRGYDPAQDGSGISRHSARDILASCLCSERLYSWLDPIYGGWRHRSCGGRLTWEQYGPPSLWNALLHYGISGIWWRARDCVRKRREGEL